MLAVQNPDAFASIILFGCIVCSFACYIYLGWVLPIKKIRDPNSTKMQKNVYGFVLFAVGICPILYLLYTGIQGRMSGGNANSSNSGGTPPPKAVAPVPNVQPSTAAGAAPANIPVVVQNPAAGNIAIGKQN